MIDLHLHTTASDGRLTPDELVERAHAAGITVMRVVPRIGKSPAEVVEVEFDRLYAARGGA